MKWDVGLSTGIAYREPIERVLPVIADEGFRLVEIATARSHVDPRDETRAAALRDQIGKLGLTVHSMHAPFGHGIDITDPDAAERRSSLERYREAADLLAGLGGELYVIHPGGEDHDWVWEKEDRLRRSVSGLTEIWKMCRERGLTLVVETPLPHLLGGNLDDFEWILSRLPEEGTAVCIDTSHTSLGGTLFEAVERFADRIVHIQASDNRGKHDDHFPPGEGIIQWGTFVRALERIRYEGVFLLEISGTAGIQESVQQVKASVLELFPEWESCFTEETS